MNYEDYKLKLLQKLKHFKIPEYEYSFNNEKTNDCIFIKQDKNFWCVCQSYNDEQITRGIFYDESTAYDFLFYLVMKKHVSIKKRWW